MEENRVDLSSLDPNLDERRWESLILRTAECAWRAREAQVSVTRLITRWAVPWMGLTAAAAAAVWVVALQVAEPSSTALAVEGADPAFEVASWASNGEVPPTSTVLTVLEDLDGTN